MNKRHINIGTIGYIGSGKASLTAATASVLAAKSKGTTMTANNQTSAAAASGERAIDKRVTVAMDAVRRYGYVRQQYGEVRSRVEFEAVRALLEADAQRPAMNPLTDGQIIKIRKSTPTDHSRPWGDTLSFARAIVEASHGIKEQV